MLRATRARLTSFRPPIIRLHCRLGRFLHFDIGVKKKKTKHNKTKQNKTNYFIFGSTEHSCRWVLPCAHDPVALSDFLRNYDIHLSLFIHNINSKHDRETTNIQIVRFLQTVQMGYSLFFTKCERFEPRSHFKSTLSLIVRVNVVLNRTAVVDSDWRFDNLCGSHLQSQSELYHVSYWLWVFIANNIMA